MTSAAAQSLRFLADGSNDDMSRPIVWSLILIFSILALFAVVQLYRKWMNSQDAPTGPGFTLSDLRRLVKEGKMTAEEYEKAKVAIIGSVKKSLEKPKVEPAGPNVSFLPPDIVAELRRTGELSDADLLGGDPSQSKLSDQTRRSPRDDSDSNPGPRTPNAN